MLPVLILTHPAAFRSIKFGGKDEAEVSAATKSKTPILKELQTGFEIANAQGNAVDSVFADTIRANTDSVQGVAATFALVKKQRKYFRNNLPKE